MSAAFCGRYYILLWKGEKYYNVCVIYFEEHENNNLWKTRS